jgi:hypothetical protein
MKNKKTAQLNKAYSKRFKIINENFFTNKETGLVLFVEYLKCLRDTIILETSMDLNKTESTKIATIVTAIAEFDAYKISQDENKKAFHWNNFCELIKLNMEEWLNLNDSV